MKISVLGPQFIFASPAEPVAVQASDPTIEKVEAAESDLDQETKDGLGRLLQFMKKKKKTGRNHEHAGSPREKALTAYQIAAHGTSLDSARGISINILC